MNKIDLKISLVLALLCFVAGFFVVPYQLETLPQQHVDELLESLPFSLTVLGIITAVQLFVFAFVLSFIGLKLARKTGLSFSLLRSLVTREPLAIDKKSVKLALLYGAIVAFTIVGVDRYYFGNRIPLVAELNVELSFYRVMAGVLYGGVFEEVLMRLFMMSLLVYVLAWLSRQRNGAISSKIYWLAIIISSVLFGVGHFPATQMYFGELTLVLIVRGLLLNGIGGVLFGYLYWKKGLEYAMFSHMFANFTLPLVFIPILY